MTSIEQILGTLNPKQLEAVMYNGGPCLIIAGAGTGKTKTLTCKIAKLIYDGVSPSRILAVTFTNKAAREMRERIEEITPANAGRVWMHTFHSFAVRMLRANSEAANLARDFIIYDETEQKKIVSLVLDEMGFKEAKKEAGYYVGEISRAKDDMLDPQSFAAAAAAAHNPRKQQAAEVYRRYQQKLISAGALDFGDLLIRAVELLKNNQTVREYYQDYFRYILADEYQDTNHTQYTLIKILAEKHRNLCVVGDPDQSIYSWRGADIRNILEFERDFKNAKIITLEQNYRSTQIILDASNKLIKKNKNRHEKTLFSEVKSGDPIRVRELATEGEEARWTANQIQILIEEDGVNLDDVAIFYRTNAQSRNFEDTFRRYQIPYRLIGSVRFYERKEIKDVLAYAKLLVNPNDTVSLLRVINTPRRAIGESAQEILTNYAAKNNDSLFKTLQNNLFIEELKPTARRGIKEFVDLIESLTLESKTILPSEIFTKILELSGYKHSIEKELEKDPEAASRMGNLNELVNAVKEYEERCFKEDTEPILSGYLQEVSLVSGDEESSGAQNGAVTLMTAHLAKGLEFPVVFVTGLEEGLFPLTGKDDDDIEEERRLCYVAMTRAKKTLNMCYSATRRIFGKTYANLASRFLFDSGLMQVPSRAYESIERREITSKRGFWGSQDRWTSRNSVSYDNSKNYPNMKTDFSKHGQAENFPKYSAATNAASFSDAEKLPVQSTAAGGVSIGSRVRHGVFGEGKITLISGSGEGAKITVVFNNGTKRVFMLRYAPLEVL
ncbi:MAG: UvrD-helicase domain-containing protein [Elusimicrobiota bacterium]|jgi:DNA helicase-2/ATP-dependent DNA helicase PcrA|nr:UvrD-helicase domain-containing protein [Elusimicrobiota bacterium]